MTSTPVHMRRSGLVMHCWFPATPTGTGFTPLFAGWELTPLCVGSPLAMCPHGFSHQKWRLYALSSIARMQPSKMHSFQQNRCEIELCLKIESKLHHLCLLPVALGPQASGCCLPSVKLMGALAQLRTL